jgi:PEP-CTERM motif
MQTSGKARAAGVLAVVIGLHLFSGSAAAEPVRVTVHFKASGDILDPDFGSDVAAGLFSVVVNRPKGFGIVDNPEFRLGADRLQFDFAGASWTPVNADVGRLYFNDAGDVFFWQFSGEPNGYGGFSPTVYPDILGETVGILYNTSRSFELGAFRGPILSWEGSATPVPEPSTLLLFASGVAALRARKLKLPNALLRGRPRP